jgi:hypothetical protein
MNCALSLVNAYRLIPCSFLFYLLWHCHRGVFDVIQRCLILFILYRNRNCRRIQRFLKLICNVHIIYTTPYPLLFSTPIRSISPSKQLRICLLVNEYSFKPQVSC